MVQPILVRRQGERYQIIAGERRWRAAREAGLESVPIVVRDVPDERLLELALVENIQRQELLPLEEAQAYQRLHDEFALTQEEVARRVGKDRSTVANTLRLLRLPREVRELLAAARLDAGHAPRAAGPRARGGPDRARARGGASRPVGARGGAPGGRPARAPEGGEARRRQHARGGGTPARRAGHARPDPARGGRGGAIQVVVHDARRSCSACSSCMLRAGRGR